MKRLGQSPFKFDIDFNRDYGRAIKREDFQGCWLRNSWLDSYLLTLKKRGRFIIKELSHKIFFNQKGG